MIPQDPTSWLLKLNASAIEFYRTFLSKNIPTSSLSSFPEGYYLHGIKRLTSDHLDKYLFGHPSGKKFRSTNEFLPHLKWLYQYSNDKNSSCECLLCCGSKQKRSLGKSFWNERREEKKAKVAKGESVDKTERISSSDESTPLFDPIRKAGLIGRKQVTQANTTSFSNIVDKSLPTKSRSEGNLIEPQIRKLHERDDIPSKQIREYANFERSLGRDIRKLPLFKKSQDSDLPKNLSQQSSLTDIDSIETINDHNSTRLVSESNASSLKTTQDFSGDKNSRFGDSFSSFQETRKLFSVASKQNSSDVDVNHNSSSGARPPSDYPGPLSAPPEIGPNSNSKVNMMRSYNSDSMTKNSQDEDNSVFGPEINTINSIDFRGRNNSKINSSQIDLDVKAIRPVVLGKVNSSTKLKNSDLTQNKLTEKYNRGHGPTKSLDPTYPINSTGIKGNQKSYIAAPTKILSFSEYQKRRNLPSRSSLSDSVEESVDISVENARLFTEVQETGEKLEVFQKASIEDLSKVESEIYATKSSTFSVSGINPTETKIPAIPIKQEFISAAVNSPQVKTSFGSNLNFLTAFSPLVSDVKTYLNAGIPSSEYANLILQSQNKNNSNGINDASEYAEFEYTGVGSIPSNHRILSSISSNLDSEYSGVKSLNIPVEINLKQEHDQIEKRQTLPNILYRNMPENREFDFKESFELHTESCEISEKVDKESLILADFKEPSNIDAKVSSALLKDSKEALLEVLSLFKIPEIEMIVEEDDCIELETDHSNKEEVIGKAYLEPSSQVGQIMWVPVILFPGESEKYVATIVANEEKAELNLSHVVGESVYWPVKIIGQLCDELEKRDWVPPIVIDLIANKYVFVSQFADNSDFLQEQSLESEVYCIEMVELGKQIFIQSHFLMPFNMHTPLDTLNLNNPDVEFENTDLLLQKYVLAINQVLREVK